MVDQADLGQQTVDVNSEASQDAAGRAVADTVEDTDMAEGAELADGDAEAQADALANLLSSMFLPKNAAGLTSWSLLSTMRLTNLPRLQSLQTLRTD